MIVIATISVFSVAKCSLVEIPLFTGISAGFPSPANDYLEEAIDLNKTLIRNPASTFFGRVKGLSMCDAGIDDDDILIVDKSIAPRHGMLAVCCIDGEFTLKQISYSKSGSIVLLPANPKYKPIVVTSENDFLIWGIVTYVIKKML